MAGWKEARGELASATGREFERRALPFMKIFRSDIIQSPEVGSYDRAGIDLFAWDDTLCFPWVVQCKGFKEKELGDSQVKQILASINAFLRSEYACDKYVLLHNRTGENRDAVAKIEVGLDAIRQSGKAKAAWLWDRQTFIAEARKRLQSIILARLGSDASRILSEHEALFRFGSVYMPRVPFAEYRLVIRRGEAMNLESIDQEYNALSLSQHIMARKEARWTLLIGPFGTGKTTTVLQGARNAGHQIVYVRAEAMTDRGLGTGTNVLLSRSVDAMGLFDDYDDQTALVLGRLAGEALASALRRGHTFVIVIDGLDENRMYSRPNGLRQLTNELAELRCPIILTTREEHFDSLRGNFERAFENLSIKAGQSRDGKILRLQLWSDDEVVAFVEAAIEQATSDEVVQLEWLLACLRSGELRHLYGDLPQHPLFLQMILDEAINGRIRQRSRAELVGDWMERKIVRDIEIAGRDTPVEVIDSSTFVERMMCLHEHVAALMVEAQDGICSLTEEISSTVVEDLARVVFPNSQTDISTILGCALLSSASARRRGTMRLRFLLRTCQEFFLARSLHNADREPNGYPQSVIAFWQELNAHNQASL